MAGRRPRVKPPKAPKALETQGAQKPPDPAAPPLPIEEIPETEMRVVPEEVGGLKQALFGSKDPAQPPEVQGPAKPAPERVEGEVLPHVGRPTKQEEFWKQWEALSPMLEPQNFDKFKKIYRPYTKLYDGILSMFGPEFRLTEEDKRMLEEGWGTYKATHLPSPEDIPGETETLLVFIHIGLIAERVVPAWDKANKKYQEYKEKKKNEKPDQSAEGKGEGDQGAASGGGAGGDGQ